MVGTSVSHYEIVRKLGEGGMGVVYQARDLSLSRMVALKFLHPQRGDPDDSPGEAARFEQEARAISALNHPNIATIHGLERAGDQRFLVLEYLPGGTLANKLAGLKATNSNLTIEQALDYSIQIADGLRHAHDRNVIHRDIKASNVMFTEEGRPKITDFGLARLTGGVHVTDSGHVMGTPPCMSPEQAQGKAVDHRSDIFSFGILLYQILTGELPFQAENAPALLHMIVYEKAPALSRHREGIPETVQPIVSKALEKDPAARYQSMGQLLEDLQSVGRGSVPANVPSDDSAETITVRLWGPSRRRMWTLGAAVVVAILMTAMFAMPELRKRALDMLHLPSLPAEKRIAVLPFSTADPANQAFSDGLNDIVSYKLAQLEQFQGSLLVVAASEINSKGVKTPSAARASFGANLAIAGTVLRDGDKLQAMVSLIDTRQLVQLRSATIEARVAEATSFRDRVIGTVVQMLDLELTAKAQHVLGAGETLLATAYSDYIEGRGYLQRFDRPGNLDKAVEFFRRSVSKDPKYALAHAALAAAFLKKYDIGRDPRNISEAYQNCARAIELNPELEPVHVTMGLIDSARGDYEGAEGEFRRVLALNPVNPEAHRGLAGTFASRSRIKEAEEAYKRAIDLRPNDWSSYNQLAAFYFGQHRYKDAETYFEKAVQLTPDNSVAIMNLGASYLEMGRETEAIEKFKRSLALNESALAYSDLGMAYHFLRQYGAAAEMHAKATQLAPDRESYWGNLAHSQRWEPSLAGKAADSFHKAIELAEKQVAVNPRDADVHARIATYWAGLGDKQKSLEEIAVAQALAPKSGYVQYRAALVYEQAGDRNRALKAVQSALESGYSREEIEKAPPLENLREDSHYPKLLER